MASNDTPVAWPPSLWAATAAPSPVFPALEGDVSSDVVIVGAGFSGLSAALHLRERGVDVVVVEAAEPGWGASGRNNGQVIPALSGHDPSTVVKRYGAAGERLNIVVRDSAAYTFDLARRHGYFDEAEAEQRGWVQPAHSPGRLKRSENRVNEWRALGAPAEFLDKQAMANMLGTAAWEGGFWNPTGGHVNLLGLARGMARAAASLGARIFARSPVVNYHRESGRWVVWTVTGARVTADGLFLATNAYTGEFAKDLNRTIAREVIPVLSWQMATKPISDNIRKTILPGRQAMSDTHRELYFARWDKRGRLITGGASYAPGVAGKNVMKTAGDRLLRIWPQLGEASFDYVWNGYVGMTPDSLLAPEVPGFPRVHQLGPNGYTWVGCNGRGVALATIFGRDFAAALTGSPIGELGLPLSEPKAQPLQPILRRIAPFALPYYRYLDRREA